MLRGIQLPPARPAIACMFQRDLPHNRNKHANSSTLSRHAGVMKPGSLPAWAAATVEPPGGGSGLRYYRSDLKSLNLECIRCPKLSMSHRITRVSCACMVAIILAVVWFASPAWAALGGDTHSVGADSMELKGQLVSTPMLQYDLHEITTGSNTLVR